MSKMSSGRRGRTLAEAPGSLSLVSVDHTTIYQTSGKEDGIAFKQLRPILRTGDGVSLLRDCIGEENIHGNKLRFC